MRGNTTGGVPRWGLDLPSTTPAARQFLLLLFAWTNGASQQLNGGVVATVYGRGPATRMLHSAAAVVLIRPNLPVWLDDLRKRVLSTTRWSSHKTLGSDQRVRVE